MKTPQEVFKLMLEHWDDFISSDNCICLRLISMTFWKHDKISFQDEDMIEFLKFHQKTALLSFDSNGENHGKSYKELLQIWKEQKPKTVYYE